LITAVGNPLVMGRMKMNISKKKHGTGAFILAGFSFIPLLGVVPGGLCVVNALVCRKENSNFLGLLGSTGIILTIFLAGFVLPRMVNSEQFVKGLEPHARSTMTSLVRHIEYYKLQHGEYPQSIKALRNDLKEGELSFSFDISAPTTLGMTAREFHYELINGGRNYMLLGVGMDATPYTEDDVYPLIDTKKDRRIGWVKPEKNIMSRQFREMVGTVSTSIR
jgi:hypothetical protein